MLVFIRGIETNILKLPNKNYCIIINCALNTLQANSQILPLDILDLLS